MKELINLTCQTWILLQVKAILPLKSFGMCIVILIKVRLVLKYTRIPLIGLNGMNEEWKEGRKGRDKRKWKMRKILVYWRGRDEANDILFYPSKKKLDRRG